MSDQPNRRRATVVADFTDAGTEERFTAGDTPMLDAGVFANYEAAGYDPTTESNRIYTAAKAELAAAKAAGFQKVGLSTVLPETARSPSQVEPVRQAYNTLVRGAVAAGDADFIVDRAAVSAMSTFPTAPNDSTKYAQQAAVGGDSTNNPTGQGGIHPTSYGTSLLAVRYASDLNAVIA